MILAISGPVAFTCVVAIAAIVAFASSAAGGR